MRRRAAGLTSHLAASGILHPHLPPGAGRYLSLATKFLPGSNAAYLFTLRHGIAMIIHGSARTMDCYPSEEW